MSTLSVANAAHLRRTCSVCTPFPFPGTGFARVPFSGYPSPDTARKKQQRLCRPLRPYSRLTAYPSLRFGHGISGLSDRFLSFFGQNGISSRPWHGFSFPSGTKRPHTGRPESVLHAVFSAKGLPVSFCRSVFVPPPVFGKARPFPNVISRMTLFSRIAPFAAKTAFSLRSRSCRFMPFRIHQFFTMTSCIFIKKTATVLL